METGFNAMGKFVPPNRFQKGYETIKEILQCDNELAWSLASKIKGYIEKDRCSYVVGCINGELINGVQDKVDEDITIIDLTGRYRILAEMLTD